MKKYLKEILTLLIQLYMFYIFPLFAGPTDMMGMVLIIIIVTFILSIFMGMFSKIKFKYIYPILISILFIPSAYLYYNNTELIHAVWYLIVSYTGLIIGIIINKIFKIKSHK